jgi:hypothetical protein
MKLKLIMAVLIVAAAAIVIFVMMSGINKPSVFVVNGSNLEIQGSFGTVVPISGISSLEMKDSMPAITYKTNGSGLGSVYKGEFTLDGGAKARLYMDTSKPPFISFSYDGTVFYINSDTRQKTQGLYDELKAAIK